MNEDFVTYELAVKLKEKGFDEPFYFFYRSDDKLIHHAMVTKPIVYCDKIDDEVVCAPTIPQVLKWLREEKGIHIEPIATTTFATKNNTAYFVLIKHKITATSMDSIDLLEKYALFDDACIAGIEYVLDNLI